MRRRQRRQGRAARGRHAGRAGVAVVAAAAGGAHPAASGTPPRSPTGEGCDPTVMPTFVCLFDPLQVNRIIQGMLPTATHPVYDALP